MLINKIILIKMVGVVVRCSVCYEHNNEQILLQKVQLIHGLLCATSLGRAATLREKKETAKLLQTLSGKVRST